MSEQGIQVVILVVLPPLPDDGTTSMMALQLVAPGFKVSDMHLLFAPRWRRQSTSR